MQAASVPVSLNHGTSFRTVAGLTRVTKSYGSRRALDAIDLRVSSGEILALLGPNGRGRRPP